MKKIKITILLGTFIVFLGSISQAAYTDASFYFCENAGTLDRDIYLNMNAGEEKEICMQFSTESESPIEITYGFSKGEIDVHQQQVCDNDMSDNNEFSKYFTPQEGKRIFEIKKSDGTKIIKEKIKMPLGMSGKFFGCLAYMGKGIEKQKGEIFSMVFRKTAKINVLIGGSESIKSALKLLPNKGKIFSSKNTIKANIDENNKLELGFLLENNGNIDQNVSIKGSIHNVLGFEKTFDISGQKISGGSKKELVTNIGIIPFYKGFFNVELTVNSQPDFGFDSANLDENLKKEITIQENGKIFIFTRIRLAIAIFAIFIIIMILRPFIKKKETK